VEDSARLQALLAESFRRSRVSSQCRRHGHRARAAVAAVGYNLVIIDLDLPDDDGISLFRDSRSIGCKAQTLVITTRAGIDDRIPCLDSGADDYPVKPLSHLELLARIGALLRRRRDVRSACLQYRRGSRRCTDSRFACS